MGFSVRKISESDVDTIIAALKMEAMEDLVDVRSEWLPVELSGEAWAFDDETGDFLWRMPMSRDDASYRYLFSSGQSIVLFEKVGYCKFSCTFVSAALRPFITDVQEKIRLAFQVAGLSVSTNPEALAAGLVPSAIFIDSEAEA